MNFEKRLRERIEYMKTESDGRRWFKNTFSVSSNDEGIFANIITDESAGFIIDAVNKVCLENGKKLKKKDWEFIIENESAYFSCFKQSILMLNMISKLELGHKFLIDLLKDMYIDEIEQKLYWANDVSGTLCQDYIDGLFEDYIEDYPFQYKQVCELVGIDPMPVLDELMRIKIGRFDLLADHDKEMRLYLFNKLNAVRQKLGLLEMKK